MRHKWDINETRMRHKWDTNETRMRHEWDTNETQMRHKWDTSETQDSNETHRNKSRPPGRWMSCVSFVHVTDKNESCHKQMRQIYKYVYTYSIYIHIYKQIYIYSIYIQEQLRHVKWKQGVWGGYDE